MVCLSIETSRRTIMLCGQLLRFRYGASSPDYSWAANATSQGFGTMQMSAIALSFLVASATLAEDDQLTWSPAQAEVWRTVEARTDAWVHNDYEAYLSLHHERWRRFSMTTSELSSKDDVARFWQGMKDSEKTHSIKLTPIAVEVYAGGSAAIAHYIMMETVEWTAETQRRASGRLMEKGRVYRVPARFSDVYVKEGDLWLYVGGYRDLTCDIMPESPFPCLDIPSAAQQSVPADGAARRR
jgi:ketosteroid isomerase-like protein